MFEPQRCLNCGNPIFAEIMMLPYCSYNCAQQIEFAEYIPEPQLEFDFEQENG